MLRRTTPLLLALLATPAGWALGSAPASGANMLVTDDVPGVGRWRIRTDLTYAPYFLKLHKSNAEDKDCPDPPRAGSESVCAGIARPIESRHYAQAATSLELGVGESSSVQLRIPLAYVQQFSADPARLPPYMTSPTAFGLGEVALSLRRALVSEPDLAVGVEVGTRVPGGTHPLGNDLIPCECPDATGQVTRQTFVVFTSSAGADLAVSYAQAFLDEALGLAARASVDFPFKRAGVERVATWSGVRYVYGMGVGYKPLPELGLHLESTAAWANPAEYIEPGRSDHVLVTETGYFRIDLVPGVSYRVADTFTVRAAVTRPLLFGGFQRDLPFLEGTLGFTMEL